MKKYLTKTFKLVIVMMLLLSGNHAISQVDAGKDTTSCDGSTNLSAIPPGGIWSTTGGASIISPSTQSTVVNNLDPGANEFSYTVSGLGNDVVIITNNQIIADAGSDITFSCSNAATLTANEIPSGGTGFWELAYPNPGVIIENSSSNITAISNLPFGNTIFIWTISANDCTSTDEISVNNSLPENNDGTDKSACTNIFNILAEAPPGGGSGIWSVAPNSPETPEFDNITNPGVEITVPIGISIVRWTINYSTCSSYKDFTLTNNLPDPNAGIDQSVCKDTVLLNATEALSGEHGVWSVFDYQGEIFTNQSIHNPTVTNLKQGTTTFIWTLSNGICTSSDFIQVENNRPGLYAGPDNTICENTYTLSADNPSPNTGTWTCPDPTVVFDDIHSNQAHASNLINNTYTFTWTVTNGTCSASDNVTIHTDYVPISAGIDKSDCADTLILSATAIPSGGSGFWTITYGDGDIDNSTSNNTIARNISEISHFKWTILSGSCTFSNEIEYVNQLPSLAQTHADGPVCSSQASITANPPIDSNESGIWTCEPGSESAIIENPSLFQTQVSNLKLGLNSFRWTIYNQYCSTFDIINITNNSISTNAGEDQIICNTSASLNAVNDGGTGYWTSSSAGVIFTNSLSPTTDVSNLSFGPNTFRWTRIDLGCVASDELIVTNNLPINVYAGGDQDVCEDIAHLSADMPAFGTGLWSLITGNGTFTNASLFQTDVNGISSGSNVYRWTVSYQNCSTSDDVEIINSKIDVTAGDNQIICNQASLELDATIPSTGQTGIWTIIGGSGLFSSLTSYNSNVTSLIKGINTYQWTLSNGVCSNSAQVTITNNTPDSAIVADDKIICTNNTEINAIKVENGVGTWSVSQGSGNIANISNFNTTVDEMGSGVNIFTWTVTKNGCSLTANQQITNNTVIAAIVEDEIHICRASHDTILTAQEPPDAGTTGIWTKLSAGSGTIENPTNYTTGISNLNNGETRFRWTVQNGNCFASDEIDIIDDYYDATASPVESENVCENYAFIIGNPGPPSGTTAWTSDNGGITFSNPTSATSTVQNLPLGPSNIFWTITNNNCAAQTSFVINNYSLVTNAGQDIFGCTSDAALNAQSLESGQTGSWTASNVAVIFENSQSPNSTVSNIPAGTSVLRWAIMANGCSASDDMLLVNNSFNISAGNDQSICGTISSIEGSDPLTGTGSWSVVEGPGIIANPTNNTTNVSNLSNGSNIFRWTVSRSGCTATDEVNITNNLYIADVLPCPDVCSDTAFIQAVGIPAESGATSLWTVLAGGGIFDNNSSNETIVRNLGIGSNYVRWTVTKENCSSFENLTINNNTVLVSAGPDQSTCETTASVFATLLSPTASGLWTGPDGIIIESPNTPATDLYNLSRGINTFTWTVIDKGCTGISTINITNNSFDTYAGPDQMVDVPNTILQATLPDATATGYWQILAGNTSFANYTDPSTSIDNLGFGLNQFRWTASWKSCNAHDDVVVIYNVAEAYAGPDIAICNGSTTMAAETPDFGTGTWSVVSGGGTFEDIHLPTTNVNNIPPGINTFRWTVLAFGETAIDEMTVTNNFFTIYAGADQQTCNNYIDLDADSPGADGTGSWYVLQGNGSFSDNFINNPTVSNLMIGTNRFIWFVERNGCFNTDTVGILRYEPTTQAYAGEDDFVCSKTDYMLEANLPTTGSGIWSSDNPSITFDNPAQFRTSAHNLSNGPNIFWWTISNLNCQSIDEVIISSYNPIEITGQPISQNLTETQDLNLTVEISGNVEQFIWQKDGINLTDNERISGSNNHTLSISDLGMNDAGNYRCIVEGYCNSDTSNVAFVSVVSGIEELYANGIKVYPNPSNGIIYIDFDHSPTIDKLIITSLSGKKLLVKAKVDEKEIIDLSEFQDGLYMLTIQKGNKFLMTKILLQK